MMFFMVMKYSVFYRSKRLECRLNQGIIYTKIDSIYQVCSVQGGANINAHLFFFLFYIFMCHKILRTTFHFHFVLVYHIKYFEKMSGTV